MLLISTHACQFVRNLTFAFNIALIVSVYALMFVKLKKYWWDSIKSVNWYTSTFNVQKMRCVDPYLPVNVFTYW